MLAPKRIRWRKVQKGRSKRTASRGTNVSFGDFGLQAVEPAWLTSRQIEAARIAMTRHMKRDAKIWIRIFPHKPVSKKPAETRMGKGKGGPDHWVAQVKPGHVLYEIEAENEEAVLRAFELASHKLPVKTQILRRGEIR
jgi:large subunit ribosomal protein L16